MFHTQFSNTAPSPGVDCQAIKEHEAKTLADPNGRQNQGAKQSFADECDINKIMDRVMKGGQVAPMPQLGPEQFPDLTGPQTFLEALDVVQRAEDAFLALPAALRAECHNRPDLFLGRIHNDRAWAEKHGLLAPSPASPESAQAPQAPSAPRTASPAAPSSPPAGPSESTKA